MPDPTTNFELNSTQISEYVKGFKYLKQSIQFVSDQKDMVTY